MIVRFLICYNMYVFFKHTSLFEHFFWSHFKLSSCFTTIGKSPHSHDIIDINHFCFQKTTNVITPPTPRPTPPPLPNTFIIHRRTSSWFDKNTFIIQRRTSSLFANNNERHYPPHPLPNTFIIHQRTSSWFAKNTFIIIEPFQYDAPGASEDREASPQQMCVYVQLPSE